MDKLIFYYRKLYILFLMCNKIALSLVREMPFIMQKSQELTVLAVINSPLDDGSKLYHTLLDNNTFCNTLVTHPDFIETLCTPLNRVGSEYHGQTALYRFFYGPYGRYLVDLLFVSDELLSRLVVSPLFQDAFLRCYPEGGRSVCSKLFEDPASFDFFVRLLPYIQEQPLFFTQLLEIEKAKQLGDAEDKYYGLIQVVTAMGHRELLKQLLADPELLASVITKNKGPLGLSILHLATWCLCDDMVSYVWELLGDKARDLLFDTKNLVGMTALQMAIIDDHYLAIDRLLTFYRDEDFNQSTALGLTLLNFACKSDSSKVIERVLQLPQAKQWFLTKENQHGLVPLQFAVLQGKVQSFKTLLKAFPGYEKLPLVTTSTGQTLLHLACQSNCSAMVEQVMQLEDADKWLTIKNKESHNLLPLQTAALNGNVKVIKALLAARPDLNMQVLDERNNTLLHLAVESGSVELIEFLFERTEMSTWITQYNNSGYSPLFYCYDLNRTQDQCIAVLDVLMRKMREKNFNFSQGLLSANTVLHFAIEGGACKLVEFLLKQPEAKNWLLSLNHKHLSPLAWACSVHKFYAVEFRVIINLILQKLRELNIDVAKAVAKNDTPFHYAIEEGDPELIQYLLEQPEAPAWLATPGLKSNHYTPIFTVCYWNPMLKGADWQSIRGQMFELILNAMRQFELPLICESNSDNTLLHCAVEIGSRELITQLLTQPEASVWLAHRNRKNCSPESYAARAGLADFFKRQLQIKKLPKPVLVTAISTIEVPSVVDVAKKDPILEFERDLSKTLKKCDNYDDKLAHIITKFAEIVDQKNPDQQLYVSVLFNKLNENEASLEKKLPYFEKMMTMLATMIESLPEDSSWLKTKTNLDKLVQAVSQATRYLVQNGCGVKVFQEWCAAGAHEHECDRIKMCLERLNEAFVHQSMSSLLDQILKIYSPLMASLAKPEEIPSEVLAEETVPVLAPQVVASLESLTNAPTSPLELESSKTPKEIIAAIPKSIDSTQQFEQELNLALEIVPPAASLAEVSVVIDEQQPSQLLEVAASPLCKPVYLQSQTPTVVLMAKAHRRITEERGRQPDHGAQVEVGDEQSSPMSFDLLLQRLKVDLISTEYRQQWLDGLLSYNAATDSSLFLSWVSVEHCAKFLQLMQVHSSLQKELVAHNDFIPAFGHLLSTIRDNNAMVALSQFVKNPHRLVLFEKLFKQNDVLLERLVQCEPFQPFSMLDAQLAPLQLTPLQLALSCEDATMVAMLFQLFDKACEWQNTPAMHGATPALYAASFGKLAALQVLLQQNPAAIAQKDDYQNTLLHLAAWSDNDGMIRYLMMSHPEVWGQLTAKNCKGDTPMLYAIVSGNLKALQALMSYSVYDPDVASDTELNWTQLQDDYQNNALHLAVISNSQAMLQFIVGQVDAQHFSMRNQGGQTPLEYAAVRGANEAHEFLLAMIEKSSMVHDAPTKGSDSYPKEISVASVGLFAKKASSGNDNNRVAVESEIIKGAENSTARSI